MKDHLRKHGRESSSDEDQTSYTDLLLIPNEELAVLGTWGRPINLGYSVSQNWIRHPLVLSVLKLYPDIWRYPWVDIPPPSHSATLISFLPPTLIVYLCVLRRQNRDSSGHCSHRKLLKGEDFFFFEPTIVKSVNFHIWSFWREHGGARVQHFMGEEGIPRRRCCPSFSLDSPLLSLCRIF
jgi:hypothetical protein